LHASAELGDCEDLVREADGVGVVLLDSAIGLMLKQTIENMDGVANIGRDDFAVERCVLVRNLGIGLNARLLCLFEVDVSGKQAAAASFEVLPVGT
jgi:hypothetical protein